MVLARWVAAALFLVALPLFLVLSNVRIAANALAVYSYAFDRYGAEERTGVTRTDLDRAARDIVLYFRDDRDLLDIRVAIDGREQALFNPREVLHMRDVKALMGRAFSVQELSLIFVVGYIAIVFLWARERSMRHLARLVALGGAVTVAVLVLASTALVAGFDDLFRQFHVISFSNDLWKLDPDRDRLIQMFPRGFWFDATLGVGLLTIVEAMLLVATGLGYVVYVDRRRRRAGVITPPPASDTTETGPAASDERGTAGAEETERTGSGEPPPAMAGETGRAGTDESAPAPAAVGEPNGPEAANRLRQWRGRPAAPAPRPSGGDRTDRERRTASGSGGGDRPRRHRRTGSGGGGGDRTDRERRTASGGGAGPNALTGAG